MANLITSMRIVCALALAFVPAYSPAFYVLYLLAGLTDMVDGTVARRTNSASAFGAKLDTAADLVFVAVCLIKLLPLLTIPAWLWVWIGVIACLKLFNLAFGLLVQKKFVAEHTLLNKTTGLLLFCLPLTRTIVDVRYSAAVVCAAATAAAVHEGYRIRSRR